MSAQNNGNGLQGKIGKQIKLPLRDAVKISLKNIRVRIGRSVITMAGITLGIAFLMSVFTTSAINNALLAGGTEEVRLAVSKVSENNAERQIWLAVLSLMVSAVGITNAMLMSVTERFREIGTMKCLGALNRFIVELFLLESSFQGMIGSILGSLGGLATITAISFINYGPEVAALFPLVIILKYLAVSIVLGTFLSVIGAIYPSYRAAKMVPADAMSATI